MDMRQLTQEVRLRHWAEQMHNRGISGLSIREWCRQQGIAEKTYYYWQRKLRAAAAEQLAQKTDSSRQALAPVGWTAIETIETKTNAAALPVEIGNCRILVNSDTDMSLLAKVCKSLATLC